MAISSFKAAKTICNLSRWSLTNLKLQKLLYLAHMVSLGRDGVPLVTERFSAWMYGPVLPALYDRVKIFGADLVCDRFYEETILDEKRPEFKLLQEIWDFFGKKEGWELVKMTHSPRGAWAKNYNPKYNVIISDKDILEDYKRRVKE